MSDRKNQSLNQITSKVLAISPADPNAAHNHFLSRLSFETDPSDVYHDITNKVSGIVVLDARTPETYARGHVSRSHQPAPSDNRLFYDRISCPRQGYRDVL